VVDISGYVYIYIPETNNDKGRKMKKKRDMDLVRKILFKIIELDEQGKLPINYSDIDIEGYEKDNINEHLSCLESVDALKMTKKAVGGEVRVKITKINPAEREFIRLLHDDEKWEKAKQLLREKGIEPLFITMKDMLFALKE
jgi:hypothetical protein